MVIGTSRRMQPNVLASARHYSLLGLVLDYDERAAHFSAVDLQLTDAEFGLLAEMTRYPGQVLPQGFLATQASNGTEALAEHLLVQHMSDLRRKLHDAGAPDD